MNEPTLETIGDYNTLAGEKRRVVRAVILSGLIIGTLYVIVANSYVGDTHDKLPAVNAAMPMDR